jgi:outer membrane protein OmpU
MKKLLIATTALVATTGVAIADVKLSGWGRFGLNYNGSAAVGTAKTQIHTRMNVDINGSVQTDAGVTFGGRIRLRHTSGDAVGGVAPSAAMLWATYGGLRMEVGNTNGAMDAAALAYKSEIGFMDRSFGDPIGSFRAFSSNAYPATPDRMGVYAAYSFGDGAVRFSWIDSDQTASGAGAPDEEVAISANYTFGQFTVSGAYADNAGNFGNEKNMFLGAEYAVNSDANVGLLWFRQDVDLVGDVDQFTLYGNYRQGAMTYRAYVANNDNYGVNMQTVGVSNGANRTKTAFGIGVDYDLGGARLSGDIHRNYTKDTVAGLGVRFDF